MATAKQKTTETKASVAGIVNGITEEQRKKDAREIIKIMKEQSGFEPKMWGPAIVGFGSYHYKYESGHEGDAPLIGFSPRKAAISLYLSSKFDDREKLLKEFGKYKASKACIYVKKLEDVNVEILKKMIANSFRYSKAKHK